MQRGSSFSVSVLEGNGSSGGGGGGCCCSGGGGGGGWEKENVVKGSSTKVIGAA